MALPPSCLCGTCRKCKQRKRQAGYRAAKRKPLQPKGPCPRCGGEVTSTNPRAIFCSHRCARQHGVRRTQVERREQIAAIKAALGCAVCGMTSPTYVLEFHHLDPETKWRSFGGGLGNKWERLEAEIAKCVVLCANHHRMVEAGDLAP